MVLKNEALNSEANTLENSIKFINEDFVYCYDGIVVLGIWGMLFAVPITAVLKVIVGWSYLKLVE